MSGALRASSQSQAGSDRLAASTRRLTVFVLAIVVATVAFVAYTRTLLPGVDLGDTAAFQAAVLWPTTSARQAYPLYYGLAAPFVHWLSAANPARGMNLFSAVWGALAAGLLAWLTATVTRSLVGGVTAGLLLAFSYTFWTQAIIAEVYTLHLALVSLIFLAARAWEMRQTHVRLAILCAVYALAFGNHLSTILLFVPLIAFIATAHPKPMRLLHPGVIASGLLIAAIGALQYTPNMLALWSDVDAPRGVLDRVAAFWFDVTKADWRATMVLGVPAGNIFDRLAMWQWDARQQFGIAGLVLAVAGVITLWNRARPWAVLTMTSYAVNTLFAFTYNVGDTHVFFLPGHYFTALAAGAGAAGLSTWRPARTSQVSARVMQTAVATVAIAFALWRGWDTWPAVDRHADRRGEQLTARLLLGVADRNAVLVSRLNWDQENALLYAGRYIEPDAPWVKLYDVLPHLPYMVRDNLAIGRDIVLTADAASRVVGAYGSFFPIVEDSSTSPPPFATVAGSIRRGSPYVLTILLPLRDYQFDANDVGAAVRALTGRDDRSGAPYEVYAGVAGEAPALHVSTAHPFIRDVAIAGDSFRIRMDSWLPTDTFRRASFGHVILDRRPILLVERGASLVWLDADGRPHVAYAGGLFAPQPRFRIPVPTSRLASR
jgi:hypothetical protein